MEWKNVAREWSGSVLPIDTYQASLGVGKDGKEYLVRSKFYAPKNSFMVEFDTADEGEDTPFLRDKVLYASSYWEARRKYYNLQFTNYAGITRIIKDFAMRKGIEL